MKSLLNKLVGSLLKPKPRIACAPDIWGNGIAELRRRTHGGIRESGAFLIGNKTGAYRQILEFVFYDDIDPHSLDTGIVHFNGNRLPQLWDYCRERDLSVVADVHVHPGGYGQSASDQADPVMPRAGHIAFIIPNYAAGKTKPGDIGQYEYLGNGRWVNQSKAGSKFFDLRKRT